MSKITLIVGLLLVVLGVVLYVNSDLEAARKWTGLIPAFVGLPVAILGGIGMAGGENARKHTAHIAVMLTLIGALGGFGRGIPGAINNGFGLAVTGQLIMGVLCLIHVALSVRSFIKARKARESAS